MAYDDDFWGGAGIDPGAGSVQYSGGGGGYQGYGTQGMGNFGSDPFAYTGGSLLTPWTQQFVAPQGSGPSASGIDMKPFSYGDFSYGYTPPAAYTGQHDIAVDQYGYGEFQSPEQFKAPTAADLEQDPSYQFRLKQGQDALLASTGGFAKALSDYNQQAASQEYKDVYARKKGEYDTTQTLARQDWDRRFANAKDISDLNWQRKFGAEQANNASRLAAYQASTDANIRGNQLGYDIAQGTYDRNRQNAQDAYNSAMQIAQSRASAGASNADEAYRRALNEYQMNYDIFQNNQNTQWNRQMQLAQLGMGAAAQQGGYGSEYAGNMGNTYGQAANARAGATMAGGNAWNQGLTGAGNALMSAYAMKYNADNGYGGGGGGGNLGWRRVKPGTEDM